MSNASLSQLDRIWKFFAPLLVLLLVADQLSKEWAESHLHISNRVHFGFNLSHNEGALFGMPLPVWSLHVLTVAILGLGVYLVVREKLWRDNWHLVGIALIVAGAVGNWIDRIRFGYVIDFIQVYWWPTYNLADVWIVAGVILFSWEFLIRENTIEEL